MSDMDARKPKRGLIAILMLLALIALASGVYVNMSQQSKVTQTINVSGTLLPQPRAISAFDLTDNNGKPFTNASLKNHWTFVFFGFTNCPHICPTTMAELNKMYNSLKTDNLSAMPQVVMISVDPERDTVKRMNTYVKSFNTAFIGATGSEQQISAMTKQLGIAYMKVQSKKDKLQTNYDIDHSGTVMLFNPQGDLVAFFSMPHDAIKIAQDFTSIMRVSTNQA